MNMQTVLEEITELPPDKQEEIADFVAFLRSRVVRDQSREEVVPRGKPTGFVGMWADRADMADSSRWVRRLRETEWESRHV